MGLERMREACDRLEPIQITLILRQRFAKPRMYGPFTVRFLTAELLDDDGTYEFEGAFDDPSCVDTLPYAFQRLRAGFRAVVRFEPGLYGRAHGRLMPLWS